MKLHLFALLIQCFLLVGAQQEPGLLTPQPSRTPAPIDLGTPRPGDTIFQVISGIPELSQLVNLIDQTGFRDFLLTPYAQFTLFAPTDEAFQRFQQTEGQIQNRDQAFQLMTYHVGSPSRQIRSFSDNEIFYTSGGLPVRINQYEDVMVSSVNGALVQGNLTAINGEIIVLDRVLSPPNATLFQILQQREDFSMFAQLVRNSNLQIINELRNPSSSLTLFIPTDQAFQGQDLTEQLQTQDQISNFVRQFISDQVIYSVGLYDGRTIETQAGSSWPVSIQGNSILLGNAPVSEVDINAVNGVAHTLSQFPSMMATTQVPQVP